MKLLLILLTICTFIFGTQNINKYVFSYNLLNNPNSISATLIIAKDNSYKITIVQSSENNFNIFKETLISQGYIKNSQYIPKIFKKTIEKNDYIKKQTYIFKHDEKKVILEELVLKKVLDNFDFDNENDNGEKQNYTWIINGNTTNLDIYAKEDILSLLFNIKQYINNVSKNNNILQINAFGSNVKNDYKVDLIIPSKDKYKKIQSLFNTKDNVFILNTHTEIFSSKSGKLYINLNKNPIKSKIILTY